MGKLKYKIVSQLLDETMQEITQSEENWCRFLATSSRLYKYPFEEQVLIFAQRPDATACLALGNSTSELAKPVLMEIGKCIWAFDREQEKLRAEEKKKQHEKKVESPSRKNSPENSGPGFGKSVAMLLAEAEDIKARKKAEIEAKKEVHGELSAGIEKNSNLTLANSLEEDYFALKHESVEDGKETKNTIIIQNEEGGQDDEIRIRTERGLHDSNASDGRTARGNSDEIRTNETAVPQGAQEHILQDLSSEGNSERTSSDDSSTGRGEGRSADSTDGRGGGRERAAQSRESDAVGTENEQYSAGSGRNRTEGNHLLLEEEKPIETYEQLSLFPSFEEQVGMVMAAEADTARRRT